MGLDCVPKSVRSGKCAFRLRSLHCTFVHRVYDVFGIAINASKVQRFNAEQVRLFELGCQTPRLPMVGLTSRPIRGRLSSDLCAPSSAWATLTGAKVLRLPVMSRNTRDLVLPCLDHHFRQGSQFRIFARGQHYPGLQASGVNVAKEVRTQHWNRMISEVTEGRQSDVRYAVAVRQN